jgi:molecular chaperone GrpE
LTKDALTKDDAVTKDDAATRNDAVTRTDAVTTGDDADHRSVVDADDVLAGVEEDALTVARRERDEYLDALRRLQADFENYKKRMLRQQTDQLDRATENLVAKLLPALDAFDLARAHLEDEEGPSPEVKALLQASGLVDDVLAKEGLERIGEPGTPFDPTVHDAVEHAPAAADTGADTDGAATDGTTGGAAGSAEPVVADVLRPGYRWKGRVIRPAMVRVRG